MRFWWVNMNQTYKHEVPGGFLWSPKTNKNGARNQFYDNMTEVSPGDIVLSFCDTRIKAVGIATDAAISSEKPKKFGSVGDQWNNEGWFVRVAFKEIEDPVRPKDFIQKLLPHFANKYNPLQATGDGNQGVYLAEISEGFISTIFREMGTSIEEVRSADLLNEESEGDSAQQTLQGRTDIGETEKVQLVLARRGQGIFKANVRLNEDRCRVTGVTDLRLLIASHIKPWSKSSDQEKLDGANGLLLSPHVDRLFDRGFISFENNGDLLRSPKLDQKVLEAWCLERVDNVRSFSKEQSLYLAYHRREIFKT